MARTPIHPGEILADSFKKSAFPQNDWPTLLECLRTAFINFWRENAA